MLTTIILSLYTCQVAFSCYTSTGANNVLCAVNCCNSCFSNLAICNSCSYGTYLTAINTCATCTDPNCFICYQNSGTDYCSSCYSGYGVVINQPQKCVVCSLYSSSSCQSVNNCSLTNMCASCNTHILHLGICISCSQYFRNCALCSSFSCYSCNSPYVLNYSASSLQCVTCNIPFCQFCTSGPRCIQCQTTKHYLFPNSSGNCVQLPYPCTFGFYIGTCLTCNTTNLNYMLYNNVCILCSSYNSSYSITCSYFKNATHQIFRALSCISGYYLSTDACLPCVFPCSTCTTNLLCSSCTDNLHAFNIGSSSCDLCSVSIPLCNTCLGQNVCTNCQSGYFPHPTASVCTLCSSFYNNCSICDQSGCITCVTNFILSSGTCKSQYSSCNAICVQCTSNPNFCLSCVKGYYWDGGSNCLPCNILCTECTSYAVCIQCITDLFLNVSACQYCPTGQYSKPYASICINCPAHCTSCLHSKGCLICDPLFQVQQIYGQNVCIDICGDGYSMELPCDQIIGIPNDGCSDSCQIQHDFNCTNISSSSTINGVVLATNTSSCSFIGTVKASLFGAKESLFGNSMFLTFKISPYLNGLPSASASQSELQSLLSLNSLTSQFASTIEVDPDNGLVTFQIDYSRDITQSNFSFQLNLNVLSATPMFQYLTSLTFNYSMSDIQQYVQLGFLYSDKDHQSARTVYYWSIMLSLLSLAFLVIGSFSKQIAGLQQNLLCQTIYIFLLFRKKSLPINLLALGGFHYSLGQQIESKNNQIINQASYPMNIDITYFANNFTINFILYFIPIGLSIIFLIYKLRFKHLLVKKDFGQQISQYCMGKYLFEITIFNFYSLVSFSYLYYNYSYQSSNYWNFLMILVSAFFTIFSFYNFAFRPEIVGFFRSAFRTFSQFRQTLKRQSQCVSNVNKFLSLRPCGSTLQNFYVSLCVNYYYIYLNHHIIILALMILSPSNQYSIILGIQIFLLIFLVLVKPYFNPQQKIRSIFTVSLYVFLTCINMNQYKSWNTIFIFLALLTIHFLVTAYIVIKSLIQNVKKKCNDRSKVVKGLFKQYENIQKIQRQTNEKNVIKELIEGYQKTTINSMNQNIEMIQMNNQDEIHRTRHHKQKEPQKIDHQEQDEQKMNENQIIHEESDHIRYQRAFQFFDKYGKAIQKDLVKQHYGQI